MYFEYCKPSNTSLGFEYTSVFNVLIDGWAYIQIQNKVDLYRVSKRTDAFHI